MSSSAVDKINLACLLILDTSTLLAIMPMLMLLWQAVLADSKSPLHAVDKPIERLLPRLMSIVVLR